MADKVLLYINIKENLSKTDTKQMTDFSFWVLIAVKIWTENEGIMLLQEFCFHV